MVRRPFGAKFCTEANHLLTGDTIVCDWNNARQGVCVPVYGILYDGDVFEFFWFDGGTKPFLFHRGLAKDPPTGLRAFRLPATATSSPCIHALRPIYEIVFDLLPGGYISNLAAYHSHCVSKSANEGQPRKSLDKGNRLLVLLSRRWTSSEMRGKSAGFNSSMRPMRLFKRR